MQLKKTKLRIIFTLFLVSAIFITAQLIVSPTTAFVGPTVGPGIGGGALKFNEAGNFAIGGNPTLDSKFLIIGPTNNGQQFRIEGDSSIPILRVNDGKVLVGDITPTTGAILQAGSIKATTSSFDLLEVKRASVYGLLKASGTAVDIVGFQSIVGNTITGSFSADNVTAGSFDLGNYAFPSSLGIGTSTNQTLPATLSVYGVGYFSENVSIGETEPAVGPARLNIATDPNLYGSWINTYFNKSVRIESNGAIEFGAGTGGTVFGMGVNNGSLYVFNTDSELNATARYNMVLASSSVAIGNVSLGTIPQGILDVLPPASTDFDTIVVGNVTGKSSIRAQTADLILNSTGTGKLYLNNYHSGDVILTTSTGGNVGVGTASPSAKLDVSGTVKMTGFRLGSSATAGHILTAAADGTGTWQVNPAVGGSGTTNYLTKWVSANSLGNSTVYETSGKVGIGTTNPQGVLDVAGGVAVGSYAGVSSPPSNGFIVSGNVGIGTASPGAQLEVVTSSQKAIRIKKTSAVAGSVDLFVAVGDGTSRTGTVLCATLLGGDTTKAQCLVHYTSSSIASTCATSLTQSRALCSAMGD